MPLTKNEKFYSGLFGLLFLYVIGSFSVSKDSNYFEKLDKLKQHQKSYYELTKSSKENMISLYGDPELSIMGSKRLRSNLDSLITNIDSLQKEVSEIQKDIRLSWLYYFK